MPERDTNGPKRAAAVALRYDSSLPAPLVLASLRGRAAERGVELARTHGVPVVRDEALSAALLPLDVGSLVPPEYWEIVAKVFVMIRKVER
ncbi:MAG: EscU/YscU/HrcU family type III secretion system export apparatus switch protein [Spirochaetia bacterium]|nr:EscU/YscU/HrcU family type III secretion system export apparatus switch protein [Spirochaetia bacterium]